MTTTLKAAIDLLRANGYRVTKATPKVRKSDRRVGPTFVAQFADGEVTRMSIFTSLVQLDLGRGCRLSRAAYESRRQATCAPPIVAGHFERDGEVLETYDRERLASA